MASFLHKTVKILSRPTIAIGFILFFGMVIRLLILPFRWINPDEGAHLLDARFILQGLIPVVDYASRQPFYTLLLAAFLKVFGVALWFGRLLPLLSSVGIGWMLYLLGKRLYDTRTGLAAAAIYVGLPYTVIWSTVVKTEMPAVFFCCLSIYLLVRALQSNDSPGASFWLSGLTAAVAFYVRQPTLYLAIAVILLLLFHPAAGNAERRRRIGLFLWGYILVCLVAVWYYSGHLTWAQILFSQLNPAHLIFSRVGHFLGVLPPALRVVDGEGFRILDQDIGYTFQAWRDSILFSLFIVIAVVLYLQRAWQRYGRQRRWQIVRRPQALLLFWPALAVSAYLFQSLQSVFYSQYFLEAIPYLTILAAAQLVWMYDRLSLAGSHIVVAVVLFYAVALLGRLLWPLQWSLAAHLTLAFLISFPLASVLWRKIPDTGKMWRRTLPAATAAIVPAWAGLWLQVEPLLYVAASLFGFTLALGRIRQNGLVISLLLMTLAALLTASWSGARIGPQYECTWSQHTLRGAVDILKRHGDPSDSVLSGAMIWTFSSGMQPYAGVTHPTMFVKKADERFIAAFQQQRPQFIILDGHTEKKFARYWAFIVSEIENNYYLLAKVPGSRKPVKIYRCAELPIVNIPQTACRDTLLHRRVP